VTRSRVDAQRRADLCRVEIELLDRSRRDFHLDLRRWDMCHVVIEGRPINRQTFNGWLRRGWAVRRANDALEIQWELVDACDDDE